MKLKKILAVVLTSIMVFSMSGMTAFATETETTTEATPTVAPTAEEAGATEAEATVAPTEAAVDPYSGVGSYMGFFLIQTTSWVYRDNFTPELWEKGDYNIIKGGPEGEPTNTTEVNDTVIDGDGEYSVSLKNIDLKDSTNFIMLGLTSNIPLDAGINVTSAVLYYDGMEVISSATQKNDNKKNIQMMFINEYDAKMKETVNTVVPAAGSSMEIKFTVEGFGYAKAVEEEPATTEAEVTTAVTAAPEEVAATEETAETEGGGLSTGGLVGIIAGVVVVIVIAVLAINSKKKKK